VRQPVGTDQARKDAQLRAALERVERTGRAGLVSMQDSLGTWMREQGLSRHRATPAAHFAFAAACGAQLAAQARAVRFARGTLTVEVDSAALLHELETFRAEDLRRATNHHLGRPDVRRIVFKPRS
jgi:hypothetical protein